MVRTTWIGCPACSCPEQEVHEGGRGLADAVGVVLSPVLEQSIAKELFELIDDDEQIHVVVQTGLLEDVDQTHPAHAQRGLDDLGEREPCRLVVAKQDPLLCQRSGQRAHGIGAGSELGHPPGRADAGHQARGAGPAAGRS